MIKKSPKVSPLLLRFISLTVPLVYLSALIKIPEDSDHIFYSDVLTSCYDSGSLDYIALLGFASKIFFCNDNVIYIAIYLISAYVIHTCLSIFLKSRLNILLVFILILNPIVAAWLLFPSKESLLIAFTNLYLLIPRRLLLYCAPALLFVVFITRPFLIPAYTLIILFTVNFNGFKFTLQNLFTVFICISLLSFTLFDTSLLLEQLAERATNATSSISQLGLNSLVTFEFSNIYIRSLANLLPVMLFGIFNTSSSFLILIFFNSILVIPLFSIIISKKPYSMQFTICYLLFVLPYSATLSNAGNAFRVVYFSILIVYMFFLKLNLYSSKANFNGQYSYF